MSQIDTRFNGTYLNLAWQASRSKSLWTLSHPDGVALIFSPPLSSSNTLECVIIGIIFFLMVYQFTLDLFLCLMTFRCATDEQTTAPPTAKSKVEEVEVETMRRNCVIMSETAQSVHETVAERRNRVSANPPWIFYGCWLCQIHPGLCVRFARPSAFSTVDALWRTQLEKKKKKT